MLYRIKIMECLVKVATYTQVFKITIRFLEDERRLNIEEAMK